MPISNGPRFASKSGMRKSSLIFILLASLSGFVSQAFAISYEEIRTDNKVGFCQKLLTQVLRPIMDANRVVGRNLGLDKYSENVTKIFRKTGMSMALEDDALVITADEDGWGGRFKLDGHRLVFVDAVEIRRPGMPKQIMVAIATDRQVSAYVLYPHAHYFMSNMDFWDYPIQSMNLSVRPSDNGSAQLPVLETVSAHRILTFGPNTFQTPENVVIRN